MSQHSSQEKLEKLNVPDFIIIVGRANTGTRLIPELLKQGGAYPGEPLNVANDLLPVKEIYAACRLFGPFVDRVQKHQWSFERAHNADIPIQFVDFLASYLDCYIQSDSPKKVWKIPNNNLIYPWLVRLFPHASFIHWTRNPADTIVKMMGIDRLEKWNIPATKYLFHDWNYKMRAVSWKYHIDIVKQSPTPENFLEIRFEDFILEHERTVKKLGEWTGMNLSPIPVVPEKVGFSKINARKWKFVHERMDELGY